MTLPSLQSSEAAGLDVISNTATSEQLPERAPVVSANYSVPWLSCVLLAVLVAAFVVENKLAVTPAVKHSPSLSTLFALGALSRSAIAVAGEWYRLFTAPLLHASITHLVGNGIALVFGGWVLKALLGRLWFFALFTVSALGGSLMSLAVGPDNLISVGASGAITGMFASLLIGSFRAPARTFQRSGLIIFSLRMLVPALLPILSTSSQHIDYSAHFGGVLAGTALTLLLLTCWPENAVTPQWRSAAKILCTIGVILFAGSAVTALANYPKYDVALIPQSELPKAGPDYQSRAAALVARYPDDPQSHLYLGKALSAAHDNEGAERELRLALTTAQARPALFGEDTILLNRGLLASFLADRGRQEEARTLAQQTCLAAQNDTLRKLFAELATKHLCDRR